jgi:4-nitrophenyl phosphatase
MENVERKKGKVPRTGPRVIALDLDGVVYAGDSPLPGAAEGVSGLRKAGYDVVFLTNNSGRSRESIARKLTWMGIPAVACDVVNSGYAACMLMKELSGDRPSSALVIGTPELRWEAAQAGMRIVEQGPCDFLLAGLDPEFTYEKISRALDALISGATFIACNRDRSYPVENGRVRPGCGPLVAAVECAWGSEAHYEAGKPNPLMLEMISRRKGVSPEEILVVGDSLESDIAMARLFGSPSVLVAQGGRGEGDALPVVDGLWSLGDLL